MYSCQNNLPRQQDGGGQAYEQCCCVATNGFAKCRACLSNCINNKLLKSTLQEKEVVMLMIVVLSWYSMLTV